MRGNKYRLGLTPPNGYKPGHIPWNKDKKGIRLSPASEFKKGQKAINHLPVGSVRIRTDKNGTKRRWVKIGEPNRWQEYARYLWLKSGGRSIPRGLLLHHQNGDALDDRMENYQLVTRSEHLKIHRPQWEKKRLQALSFAMKNRWILWRLNHPIKAARLAKKRMAQGASI